MEFRIKGPLAIIILLVSNIFLANAFAQMNPTEVPIFRMAQGWNFFLTSSCTERQSVYDQGFETQGILGFAANTPGQGRQELFRFSTGGNKHFYTLSKNEGLRNGFKLEEWSVYTYTQGTDTRRLLYRLSKGSDHLYTVSPDEKAQAMSQGWRDEHNVGYIEYAQIDPCPIREIIWVGICSCNIEEPQYSCHGSWELRGRTEQSVIDQCASRTNFRGTMPPVRRIQ